MDNIWLNRTELLVGTENINKLQELNLDGSNIEDTVCTNLLNKGVNIHYSDEYLPF